MGIKGNVTDIINPNGKVVGSLFFSCFQKFLFSNEETSHIALIVQIKLLIIRAKEYLIDGIMKCTEWPPRECYEGLSYLK